MKYLRLIYTIWTFIAYVAFCITEFDKFIDQINAFRDWLNDEEE
jgi:hypothetical protein